MIAQDFARVGVLASTSIAVAYGAASMCVHAGKRQARARQRGLLPARTSKTDCTLLKRKELYTFDKRLGEICGLAALRNILGNVEAGIPDYVVEKAARCAEAHEQSVRMFRDAGGRIALGTDAGTPFNLHGENAAELRYMVEVGLTNLEALRAGTSNAADLMGLDDRGRIVEGAAADLLLVDGDPSRDISAAADRGRHRRVVKSGAVVTGRARQA